MCIPVSVLNVFLLKGPSTQEVWMTRAEGPHGSLRSLCLQNLVHACLKHISDDLCKQNVVLVTGSSSICGLIHELNRMLLNNQA